MTSAKLTNTKLKSGVLGWPVAHSRSPLIHGHWLQTHGIDGSYEKLAVAPEDFAAFVRAMPARGFVGCNVTVPHKTAAFELADSADALATRLGAANTLVFSDGKITAYNTDGYGFLANIEASLREAGENTSRKIDRKLDWQNHPVLVLGAGGAARAIIAALADAGVPELRVANRSADKVPPLAALCAAGSPSPTFTPVDWAAREDALAGCRLVVNTTSLGMTGQPPLDLSLDGLGTLNDDIPALVADIVYAPLQTTLLQRAARAGHIVCDGLGMLLHQAVPGFEMWFGTRPQVTPALRDMVIADLEN